MGITSVIFGCKGLELEPEERAFFTKTQPWGFILFGRNVDTPEQVAALVADLKSCVEHDDVPILIDQEGGRVRRLRPPHWPDYVSGSVIGDHYKQDKARGLRIAWLQSRLMACDLIKLGINVDCLPVLDVPVPGSHDVIGDRAYGHDVDSVTDLGLAASNGLLDGGVLPVIKHIPGHGRAGVDSHKALPVVTDDLETLKHSDFEPFKRLNKMPMAMTAHVTYEAIDKENCATLSKPVISDIIREFMGFDGLIMCDDISMHALSGDFSERTQRAFAAGCDIVLHCHGIMDEMEAIIASAPELTGDALRRANDATKLLHISNPCDEAALREEYARLCETEIYGQDPTEEGQWHNLDAGS